MSTAVLVYQHQWRACSEEEVNVAVSRILDGLYDVIILNPATAPEPPYDLWVLFPYTSPNETPLDVMIAAADAAVAIDIDDSYPGVDFYLTTVDPMLVPNVPVTNLLNCWGVTWHGQPMRPQLPYIHACSDAVPPWTPFERKHVVWNVEHWYLCPEQEIEAEKCVDGLREIGIERIWLLRTDRGGIPATLHDLTEGDVGDEVPAAQRGIDLRIVQWPQPADTFEAMMMTAYAYVVSAPCVSMLSIDIMLARGIPVVGARSHRFSSLFTDVESLPEYRDHPELYELRRQAVQPLFSDEMARGSMVVAIEQARAMRARRRRS